ncbi:hypothetical protein ACFY7C_36770 [Streptomyces sp. NPDC012769]|uniref:hypothetical protein n=1 Tax=Streptomyces sp. NPDC012769 TaxID=3364848 RepID=UPI0036BAF9AC
MTENQNTQAETPELSEDQKREILNSLSPEFQQAVKDLNADIDAHNKDVNSIISAEAKDPKLIKAEIFETSKDKEVKRQYEEYLKLIQSAEELKNQAYDLIEKKGLMPKELSEAEIENLKKKTADNHKPLKDKVAAFIQMENMLPFLKGKLVPLINEIATRRGTATKGASSSQEGAKRIRFKRILVNNVTEDENGNKVYGTVKGEEKYTFTFASQYLKKQHKGINWTAKDLTDAYLQGIDENNLPESHEFTMNYTFKDANGNDQTIPYTIRAER